VVTASVAGHASGMSLGINSEMEASDLGRAISPQDGMLAGLDHIASARASSWPGEDVQSDVSKNHWHFGA
jgi:hypothetical protein